MARIYVASSWRNGMQPEVVQELRAVGHWVYDFREPRSGDRGFSWSDIDEMWRDWDPETFAAKLHHPIADSGFRSDKEALDWADVCVMVLPCGRSASLEAGYMIGQGKQTAILLAPGEPELMFRLADKVCCSVEELIEWLGGMSDG